jgi:hypothetical protein
MEYKYWNQLDYPEIPYGDGTVASSGCGLCSACMVVENLTDYTFNGFIAGRRGTAQTDKIGSFNRKDYVGFAVSVDLAAGTQTCRYTNSDGNAVSVYNPFVEGEAKTEFVLNLK